jgi:uncharacterized protein
MKKGLLKKVLFWSFLILVIGLGIFFHFIGPRMIVVIDRGQKEYPPITDFDIKHQPLVISANDGAQIKGIYCQSNLDTTYATVVFVHGIRSKKEYYFERAEEMANQGIATLVFDLRAHGESDGDYCTYGQNEVGDIQCFVDTLLKLQPNTPIGLWGQSLGGAISLLTLSKEPRLSFGIIESTYANLNQIIKDYSVQMIGFGLGWINDYVIWRAEQMAGFDQTLLNPEEACPQIKQPIFYVHGTQDDKILIDYGQRNFKAIQSLNKLFVPVEGADHMNVWKIGGPAYFSRIYNWVKNGFSE